MSPKRKVFKVVLFNIGRHNVVIGEAGRVLPQDIEVPRGRTTFVTFLFLLLLLRRIDVIRLVESIYQLAKLSHGFLMHLMQLPEELLLDVLLRLLGNVGDFRLELLQCNRLVMLLLIKYNFLEPRFHLLEQGVDC